MVTAYLYHAYPMIYEYRSHGHVSEEKSSRFQATFHGDVTQSCRRFLHARGQNTDAHASAGGVG